MLDRLLLLNHARHEEEVQAGLLESKGAKGKAGKAKKGANKDAGGKNGRVGGDVGGATVSEGKVEVVDGDLAQGTLF